VHPSILSFIIRLLISVYLVIINRFLIAIIFFAVTNCANCPKHFNFIFTFLAFRSDQ